MNKECWDELLSNFSNIIFCKLDKDDPNSELGQENEMRKVENRG